MKALVARHPTVNARERWLGETPLMWAAAENHAVVVRELARAGAEIDSRRG